MRLAAHGAAVSSVWIRSHGASIRLDGPPDELDRLVGEMSTSGASPVPPGPGTPDETVVLVEPGAERPGTVYCGPTAVASGDDIDELRRAMRSSLHLAVATHARNGVFIHAGVVQLRGAAIVLPGRSMAGKSTLVRALLDAGATHFSEEYAVLDDESRVHPYPKPISCRRQGGTRATIPVDRLAWVAEWDAAAVPVEIVANLRYAVDARWPPCRVTGAAAALPLIDNAVAVRLSPRRVLDAVGATVERSAVWVGDRPDVSAVVPWLLGMIG